MYPVTTTTTAPNVQSVLTTDEKGDLFGLPVKTRPAASDEKATPPPKASPPPEDPAKKGGTAP